MEFIKDILDQMQLYHYFITAYIMPDEYDLPVEKKDTDFEDDYENQPFAD